MCQCGGRMCKKNIQNNVNKNKNLEKENSQLHA